MRAPAGADASSRGTSASATLAAGGSVSADGRFRPSAGAGKAAAGGCGGRRRICANRGTGSDCGGRGGATGPMTVAAIGRPVSAAGAADGSGAGEAAASGSGSGGKGCGSDSPAAR